MNIGIVGLGLIGGSMAKSIKARTAHTVWGADLNPETMTLARMCGAVDGPLTDETLGRCDLLLVAICPGAAIDWVRQHAPRFAKTAIVVDLCGVKRVVVEALSALSAQYGFSYIGGHPMAGRERGGFTAATDDLAGADAVTAQSVHAGLTDDMGGQLGDEVHVDAVVRQRHRHVGLAAAVGVLEGISLHEAQMIVGLQADHDLTKGNDFHW